MAKARAERAEADAKAEATDGGSVFAKVGEVWCCNLTVRDVFAAAAFPTCSRDQSLQAWSEGRLGTPDSDRLRAEAAEEAYRCADALLAARRA